MSVAADLPFVRLGVHSGSMGCNIACQINKAASYSTLLETGGFNRESCFPLDSAPNIRWRLRPSTPLDTLLPTP